MGIPSYFSHIIKNYKKIIKNLAFFKNNQSIDHLFLDSNSLIYDAVYFIQAADEHWHKSIGDFENLIIDTVITNIKKILTLVNPAKGVFIAFDGVAPLAKMQQQKTRRYKSNYMSSLMEEKNNINWSTSCITPGTKFMDKLSTHVENAFLYQEIKYGLKTIIVSGSNDPGEGEHKLTEYMRTTGNTDEIVGLYGLDADLIMLSMFHLKYYKNIYVFREAPEFLKNSIQIDMSDVSSDNLYFLDIDFFASCLLGEMDCVCYDRQRIYDYVFMCFLLGNDFLPHFPALNIRTQGIQVLMDIYRLNIGNQIDRFLVSKNGKINWKTVGTLLKEIAKREPELIKNEYFVRNKFDKYNYAVPKTQKEKDEMMQNCPVIFRCEEKYICPEEPGWESRYYKSLLSDVNKSDLCINYLEGLEWTFKYYSSGCPDWRWKYNYHYPPLFKDLVNYVPHFETDFISSKKMANLSPYTQLSYVLPKKYLHLLPEKISSFLRTNYGDFYPDQYEFQWAFCRYFWEAHPLLPEISVDLLEQLDTQFRMAVTTR